MIKINYTKWLLSLQTLWHRVLQCLAWVNTRLLLGSVFFFIFTPIACVRRLRKKDLLRLAQQTQTTYRINVVVTENDLRRPF